MSGWRAASQALAQLHPHTGSSSRLFQPRTQVSSPQSTQRLSKQHLSSQQRPMWFLKQNASFWILLWFGVFCVPWLSTYFQTWPCLQSPAFEWPSPFIYNESLNWIWQWQRCNACSNVLKYINSWTHNYCIFCYQYSNKLPIKPCYKKIEFSLKSTGPVYYCRNHIREDITATLAQNKPDST